MNSREKGGNNPKITLIKIKKNDEHAQVLYELLKQKKHKISHKSLPTYAEHVNFVVAHPYRIWYLIKVNGKYIGSIYAYKNNGIGVSINSTSEKYLRPSIETFLAKNKPLKPIKSVRSSEFGVYAAPTDKYLIFILKQMGAKFSQVTYIFRNNAS